MKERNNQRIQDRDRVMEGESDREGEGGRDTGERQTEIRTKGEGGNILRHVSILYFYP